MIVQLAGLEGNWLQYQTLVVLATEFGRTPRINDSDGRDNMTKRSRAF